MSEFPKSADLAWEAAHAANQAFDAMQQAEAADEQTALAVEFAVLQAMAGVVFAPSSDETQETLRGREAAIGEKLTTPLRQLVSDLAKDGFESPHKPPTHERVFNILDRETAFKLRDVLIIGREGVGKMRNLGDKGVDFLQGIIEAADPKLEWSRFPSITYVAKLCSGPGQVPARAIDAEFDSYFATRTGANTLTDLLELNVSTLAEVARKRHIGKSEQEIDVLAQQLYKKILTYASELDAAIQVRERGT